jgi:3-oxoacyl-[acyl-carrier protein] reductase
MDKKLALIIGGSGGIGGAVTKRLIRDGMRVCCTYFKNKEKIRKFRELFGNDSISFFKCDARKDTDVETTVEKILRLYKKIDVVVFTVTVPLKNKRILELEWCDIYEHFELQLKAMMFVLKSLRGQIRSGYRTKFIAISSEACIGSPPKGLSHYIAAKYGAMGFSKAMAVELVQYGSTINMISPGMVDTSLLKDLPHKLIEVAAHNNPLKRIATPEDIANVVSFLASDEADYLNGVNIPVNGGGVII